MSILAIFQKGFFSRHKEINQQAHNTYSSLVRQARNPIFYEHLGITDDLFGRFEMITMHLFLAMEAMKKHAQDDLAQEVADIYINDLDLSLREMGVSDTRIGKRVKHMAAATYERLAAYREAMENDEELAKVIFDYAYFGKEEALKENINLFCQYIRTTLEKICGQDEELLSKGLIVFPPVENIIKITEKTEI